MQSKEEKFISEGLGTILGAFIMALAVALFLLPNELTSGGFSGIATILYYTAKFPMGATILALNAPLFIMAGFKIGKSFFAKALIGTTSLSLFIDVLDKYQPLTNDRMLAAIYGGILTGIGTAIILKSNSSTGGSEILSILIKRRNKKFQTGQLITIIDAIIVITNAIVFKNIEVGLYSVITIYLMGLMIDIIFEGIFFSKLLFVISDKNDIIAKEIETKISRGVTGLYGKGMYKEKDKMILMCAVSRNDIAKMKKLIMDIDDSAFIIVTNSREVLGAGFKRE